MLVGTRTTVTSTDCIEAGAGVGGGEEEFLAERATRDHPDSETSRE